MARASAEEWTKRVERWRDSGLTAKEFAAEAGFNAGTLLHWSWKLRSARGEASRRARPPRQEHSMQGGASAAFVELPATSLLSSSNMLELIVGKVRVRVPAGFDEDTLGRVLRAVGAQR